MNSESHDFGTAVRPASKNILQIGPSTPCSVCATSGGDFETSYNFYQEVSHVERSCSSFRLMRGHEVFSNSRLKKFFWVWTHRSIDLFETFERLAPRTTKGLRWVRNSSCRRKHILRAAKTSDPAVFQDFLRLYDTFWVRMQFDAKKESSSSDPKLKDEEHLHTLWSCNYLQPDFQNPHQGLVRGSTSRTRVFALLQASLYCFAFHSNAEKSFVYETLWRWQVSKGTRFNLWVRVCASGRSVPREYQRPRL